MPIEIFANEAKLTQWWVLAISNTEHQKPLVADWLELKWDAVFYRVKVGHFPQLGPEKLQAITSYSYKHKKLGYRHKDV